MSKLWAALTPRLILSLETIELREETVILGLAFDNVFFWEGSFCCCCQVTVDFLLWSDVGPPACVPATCRRHIVEDSFVARLSNSNRIQAKILYRIALHCDSLEGRWELELFLLDWATDSTESLTQSLASTIWNWSGFWRYFKRSSGNPVWSIAKYDFEACKCLTKTSWDSTADSYVLNTNALAVSTMHMTESTLN